MTTFAYEPEADLSNFGLQLANDPESGALLVNAEKAEQFDPRVANDVEGLLFLGRLTSDFSLYGHSFTLRTLTRGERLAINLFVRDYEDTFGLADALETAYLALAIQLVDGRPLSLPLAENEPIESYLKRNFKIVGSWMDPIIEAIYSEYARLLVRQKIALNEFEGKLTAGRTTFES